MGGTGHLKFTFKVGWDLSIRRPGRVGAGGAQAGRRRGVSTRQRQARRLPAGPSGRCRPEAAGYRGRAVENSLGLYAEAAMWPHGV